MTASLFDLIDRIARKDEAALEELRRLTETRLMASVIQIVRNRWTAEEILQDVFTYVWLSAHRYDRYRSNPLSWLQMLCRSRALDSFRSTMREPFVAELDERIGHIPVETGQSPDAFWTRDRLHLGLARLGPQQRDFIDQAFFEGFTHTEIAARSGLPLGTVKTRIRGALLQLREAIPHPAA